MLKAQINVLRSKLEQMLASGSSFENIYDLSVRLDKLIVRYYKEKDGDPDRLT